MSGDGAQVVVEAVTEALVVPVGVARAALAPSGRFGVVAQRESVSATEARDVLAVWVAGGPNSDAVHAHRVVAPASSSATSAPPNVVAVSADERLAGVATSNGALRVWELRAQSGAPPVLCGELAVWAGSGSGAAPASTALAFGRANDLLAVCASDGRVAVVDVVQHAVIRTLRPIEGSGARAVAAGFAGAGEELVVAVTAGADVPAQLVFVSTETWMERARIPLGAGDAPLAVWCGTGEERLVRVLCASGTLVTVPSTQTQTAADAGGRDSALDLSSDEEASAPAVPAPAATASSPSAPASASVVVLDGVDGTLACGTLAHDGGTVAGFTSSGALRVWSAQSGALVATCALPSGGAEVTALSASASSVAALLALGSASAGVLAVWPLGTRAPEPVSDAWLTALRSVDGVACAPLVALPRAASRHADPLAVSDSDSEREDGAAAGGVAAAAAAAAGDVDDIGDIELSDDDGAAAPDLPGIGTPQQARAAADGDAVATSSAAEVAAAPAAGDVDGVGDEDALSAPSDTDEAGASEAAQTAETTQATDADAGAATIAATADVATDDAPTAAAAAAEPALTASAAGEAHIAAGVGEVGEPAVLAAAPADVGVGVDPLRISPANSGSASPRETQAEAHTETAAAVIAPSPATADDANGPTCAEASPAGAAVDATAAPPSGGGVTAPDVEIVPISSSIAPGDAADAEVANLRGRSGSAQSSASESSARNATAGTAAAAVAAATAGDAAAAGAGAGAGSSSRPATSSSARSGGGAGPAGAQRMVVPTAMVNVTSDLDEDAMEASPVRVTSVRSGRRSRTDDSAHILSSIRSGAGTGDADSSVAAAPAVAPATAEGGSAGAAAGNKPRVVGSSAEHAHYFKQAHAHGQHQQQQQQQHGAFQPFQANASPVTPAGASAAATAAAASYRTAASRAAAGDLGATGQLPSFGAGPSSAARAHTAVTPQRGSGTLSARGRLARGTGDASLNLSTSLNRSSATTSSHRCFRLYEVGLAQMRARQAEAERARIEREERQRAEEIAACTFRPEISHASRNAVAATPTSPKERAAVFDRLYQAGTIQMRMRASASANVSMASSPSRSQTPRTPRSARSRTPTESKLRALSEPRRKSSQLIPRKESVDNFFKTLRK